MHIVRKTIKKFPFLAFQAITDKNVLIFRPTPSARILAINAKLPIKYYYSFEDMPKENWFKVIYTALPFQIKQLEKYLKSISDTTENLMASSICSYEMVNECTNKGKAVLKLAEILGIEASYTGAIGDYFNDYDMLKTVGLPACCGQAPKAMHEIAEFHACHCNHGAVADLLEYIMNDCKK